MDEEGKTVYVLKKLIGNLMSRNFHFEYMFSCLSFKKYQGFIEYLSYSLTLFYEKQLSVNYVQKNIEVNTDLGEP